MYVCMYVYMYVCMYVYICVCICMYAGMDPARLFWGGHGVFLRRFRGIFAAFRADFVPFHAVFAVFIVVLRQMLTHYIALNNIYHFFLLFR